MKTEQKKSGPFSQNLPLSHFATLQADASKKCLFKSFKV